MNENNVGKSATLANGVFLKVVGTKKAMSVITKYKLKFKKAIVDDPTTETAIMYDKENGTEAYLFLLPKSNGCFRVLNKGIVKTESVIKVLTSLYI